MASVYSKNKYGNKKIEADGIKFDSKLEKYMYDMLTKYKVKFDFQVDFELIPKFNHNNVSYRSMKVKVDFVIPSESEGISYIVDTKGFATKEAKLKYKFLKYKFFQEGSKNKVVWLQNKNEVIIFVLDLVKNNEKA